MDESTSCKNSRPSGAGGVLGLGPAPGGRRVAIRPVASVHGLWLLASSWDPWRALFEERGYATLAPDWPDDPATVEEGRAHPEIFAGKTIGAITERFVEVIKQLNAKPAVVGHSFGGLITQKLAGQGLASVSVPIDPTSTRAPKPRWTTRRPAGAP